MDYSNYAEMCSEKSYNAKKASTQCQRLFHCLMLKNDGVKVFETLLFDMDQGSISIYIDEINMHHKLRLREDYRVDSCIFFEEQLTVVSFLRNKKKYAKNPEVIDEKRKMFKSFTKLEDIQNNFEPDEYLVLKIFDKVKVKVETTTEFPLDIVCTLMFT